jgi:acyloxyacyl hydrolase
VEKAAMSSTNFGWICLLLIVFIPVIDGRLSAFTGGTNGGADCASCSVVLGLIDKLAIVHNETIEHTLELACELLPGEFKGFCKLAVEFLGKFI